MDKSRRQEAYQNLLKIFHEDSFSTEWFNPNDLTDSMRSAMIIRLSKHIATDSFGSDYPEDYAKESQAFLSHVLARKPFKTTNRQLIDMTHAAAQMVSRSWEVREGLINKFLINER